MKKSTCFYINLDIWKFMKPLWFLNVPSTDISLQRLVKVEICTSDGVRRAGSQDYLGTPQSPLKTRHISTHPTKKQAPTLSQELRAGYLFLQIVRNPHRILARGSDLFVSGMCGSVWGLLWRLQGPYVFPRPTIYR